MLLLLVSVDVERMLDLVREALSVRGRTVAAIFFLVNISLSTTLLKISKSVSSVWCIATYTSVEVLLRLAQCILRNILDGAAAPVHLRSETRRFAYVAGTASL